MKTMKIFLLIFSCLIISSSCVSSSTNLLVEANENQTQSLPQINSSGELSIEDIKFEYDKSIFSDVKNSIVPASPLENKADKPDFLQSRYINFQLSYKNIKKSPAEISIFKVDEFKQAYTLEPQYVQIIEKSLAELREIINRPDKINPSVSKQLPLVPLYDAHQEFYAKAKIIKFQNGKGLLFLTQTAQESTIINNEDLVYIFQGLTHNNRYFIYAEFPVSAEGLPEKYTETFEDYKMPDEFYGTDNNKNMKAHDEYRNKIALRLDNLKQEKFMPNLSKIESLLASIKIK